MREEGTSRETRLRHDFRAHVRATQISGRVIFGYCEGRNTDSYVYSEIIRSAEADGQKRFVLYKVEEITSTGGKDDLARLFRHFEESSLLASSFKGKNFCSVFFLDKDVDDLRGSLIVSPHVLYTEAYNLEAQIYLDTDLKTAVAIGLSIDADKVPEVYHDAKSWIHSKAVCWREWLELCIFSSIHGVDAGCGYKVPSKIHTSSLGALNQNAYNEYKNALKVRSGLTESEFDERYALTRSLVDSIMQESLLHSVFNGKWLGSIITAEITKAFSGKRANLRDLGPRIFGAAIARVDYSKNWAGRQSGKLARLFFDTLPS